MTREEAITVFKAFMDNLLFSDVHKAAFSIAIHDIKQRHDWDINKLMLVPKTEWEQETILDKIRAEIGNINLNEVAAKYEDRFYGFQQEVIKILDKYKAESEGEE